MYFPVLVTYITRRLKIAATTPIVKKLSKKVTILMSATLLIISEQNIHQFITFNFESCCYQKIPQYLRLAQIRPACRVWSRLRNHRHCTAHIFSMAFSQCSFPYLKSTFGIQAHDYIYVTLLMNYESMMTSLECKYASKTFRTMPYH